MHTGVSPSVYGSRHINSRFGFRQMEVCVDCVDSAKNAEAGGATRLELCSALSEGGLTPSVGLLRVVKSLVKIPVFVMIRPRRGLDFVYSEDEVEVMEIDINTLKKAGADGFVFGALTPNRRVDEEICNRLLNVAAPVPCTFHRAFDVTEYPLKDLETIISLGFERILTSGEEENAFKGSKLIKSLVEQSSGRIVIMAGAGVSEENLECILRETGVKEFHASARSKVRNVASDFNKMGLSMGSSDSDSFIFVTDKYLVKNMIQISKNVWDPVNK